MNGGYMGKILWVNLSNGEIKEETPEDSLYRDYIGGYGVGARLLYSRQKPNVDPLGPENIFGLLTGPLVGTPVPSGTRYTAVGKSPLTGGWGDANAGGDFAPHLKFAGYDAVFFTGKSDRPVYLLIDEGKAVLKDASALWGKDGYETEDTLKAEYGDKSEVVCIGPSGEKLSLISCIVGNRGAAAARSGLGAVMGSKKLKAVVARGSRQVPVVDRDRVMRLRKEHLDEIRTPGPDGKSYFDRFHTYGTASMTYRSAHSGDSPVKNWNGVGVVDYPDISQLTPDASIANLEKHSGCWQCPVQCEGRMKAGIEYNYPRGARRPEYETYSAFGSMCLNSNLEAINMANHICNAYGLDTISAGATIAFAMECYENGIITKKDTGGIELVWGDHKAMIEMTWKLAKREGLGDVLADGVKVAAEKLGKGAEKFAIHVGGQELPMHDPKLMTSGMGAARTVAALYHIEPTPARHMQGIGASGFVTHIVNVTGVCIAGGHRRNIDRLAGWVSAVTGEERSSQDMLKAGERILNLRHAFGLREGINPLKWAVNPRMVGDPPQTQGPLAKVRADVEAQDYWNLGQLDWDRVTTKPSKAKLLSLGLKDVADDLWPPAPPMGVRGG